MADERGRWSEQDEKEYQEYHRTREQERQREAEKQLPEIRRNTLPARKEPARAQIVRRQTQEDWQRQRRTRYLIENPARLPAPSRYERARAYARQAPRRALIGIGSYVLDADARHRQRRDKAGGRINYAAQGFFSETRSYRRQMFNPFSMSGGRSGGMNPYLVGDLFRQPRRAAPKRRRGSRRAQHRRSSIFPEWL